MANSWSFLYDEMNMSNSPDTINFTDFGDVTIAGGENTDTISCYGANDFLAGVAMDTIFGVNATGLEFIPPRQIMGRVSYTF